MPVAGTRLSQPVMVKTTPRSKSSVSLHVPSVRPGLQKRQAAEQDIPQHRLKPTQAVAAAGSGAAALRRDRSTEEFSGAGAGAASCPAAAAAGQVNLTGGGGRGWSAVGRPAQQVGAAPYQR